VSEWLDLMLDEIARKKREAKDAREERERRQQDSEDKARTDTPRKTQSK